MRSLAIVASIVVAGLVNPAIGQLPDRKEKFRCFVEPADIILTVVAYQPDSPLEFVQALPIHEVDSGVAQVFQVRNRSRKPIRSFIVATVTSVGGGSKWGIKERALLTLLKPGDVYPSTIEGATIEIVPLTQELRNRHGLQGPMKGVVTFIIVRVESSDGSIYDAENVYDALKSFSENNPIVPN
jgi:hypothetical protein